MRSKAGSDGGTPATTALTGAGIDFWLHSYEHHPDAASFGAEASQALGVDPGRMFKTLLASAQQRLVSAVVPVSGRLDLRALAQTMGAKKVRLAEPAVASRSSGYVVGGISPIGQRTPLPTVIDATAENFETILISAGKRGLQIELAPQDLISITDAQVADIVSRSG
jgi:Cys-tRNA(Pro)/Cys-tRNA(Cys) deacylase